MKHNCQSQTRSRQRFLPSHRATFAALDLAGTCHVATCPCQISVGSHETTAPVMCADILHRNLSVDCCSNFFLRSDVQELDSC